MLVTISNLTLKYYDKLLFDNASIVIEEHDKIGLIGINGTGKSTLLKIIKGLTEYDHAEISYKKDIKIGYLSQEDDFNLDDTIYNTFLKHHKMDEYEVLSNLYKYGLNDHNKLIKELSGGERKRLQIAILFSYNVDLYLLDEPTNHMDIWMIENIENILKKLTTPFVLVTHDRYILERCCNKIIEIDKGDIFTYNGNYSTYLTLKDERMMMLAASSRKLKQILKKEAEWIKSNPQARSTKPKERIEKFKSLERQNEILNDKLSKDQIFNFSSLSSRIGKTTIEILNLAKSYPNKLLFSDFSYNLPKFDRLGIIGENGCGKSSLLKIIAGIDKEYQGDLKIGETIKIGYFSQTALPNERGIKVLDYLKKFGEVVNTIDGTISASQLLENFNFTSSQIHMNIEKLSGGEKRRLQLLTVLIKNPNVLLLDEPTNDLDIYTISILESYLENFVGAVIVVSHDRYFLDKIVNHLLVFENKKIKEYNNIITDYLKNHSLYKETKEIKEKIDYSYIPRFTSREKKEYDNIENDIMNIENDINDLKHQMELNSFDYEKLMELEKQIKEKEQKKDYLYERWEYLNDLNDKIKAYQQQKIKEAIDNGKICK